jgi:ubiquinol oxidase
VFVNIRDDEAEHVKTMVACQQPTAQTTFKSPHSIEAEVVITSTEAKDMEALSS